MAIDRQKLIEVIIALSDNTVPSLHEDELVHHSEEELLDLLRFLMNIWPPEELSQDVLAAQDAVLKELAVCKGVVTVSETETVSVDPRLRLWCGDITRLEVGAITNAANGDLLGCDEPEHDCIDNAIHSAAGVQLRQECDSYMLAHGEDYQEPSGTAVLTKGYNLPAGHVIHTVGPNVGGGNPTAEHQRLLASCYRETLAAAHGAGLDSVALCSVSTGEFGYPKDEAADIAVRETVGFLEKLDPRDPFVIVFVVFSEEDLELYRERLN